MMVSDIDVIFFFFFIRFDVLCIINCFGRLTDFSCAGVI